MLRFGARRLGFGLGLGSALLPGPSSLQLHDDLGVWRTVVAYRSSSFDLTFFPLIPVVKFDIIPEQRARA